MILLFMLSSSPFSPINISAPNSLSSSETNLKVKLAVFPKRFFILLGSSKPGNSINILSFPLLIIVGSLVPTSSILFLTISRD